MKQSRLTLSRLFSSFLIGVSLMTALHNPLFADEQIKTSQVPKAQLLQTSSYTFPSLAEAAKTEVMYYTMPYRTGEMASASALLFYPTTEKPQDGWKIVVWTHGTVGVANNCAPSLQPINDNFKVLAQSLLDAGYVIVAPDYEGLGQQRIHPYLNLKSEADAAIYAVNALKAANPDDFQGDWMVVGQSQGGQAAIGTAEYANDDPYFKGAVAGAPASSLDYIIGTVAPKALTQLDQAEANAGIPLPERNSLHSFATLLSYGAFVGIGIKADHPDFDYESLFYPRSQPFAAKAEDHENQPGLCLNELRELWKADIRAFLAEDPNHQLTDYPGINIDIFEHNPVLQEFFKISQPGTQRIDKPLLIIQGEKDTNVPASVTTILAERLKSLGSEAVNLVIVPEASHQEAIVWENDRVVEFVKSIMPAK